MTPGRPSVPSSFLTSRGGYVCMFPICSIFCLKESRRCQMRAGYRLRKPDTSKIEKCQKLAYISDRRRHVQGLTEQILAHAKRLPEGEPISAKGLLHLGTRAAVDQALSRLAERGHLLRAGRGIYLRPVEGRFGTRTPSRTSPQVLEARIPSLSSFLPTEKPAISRSTTKPVIPR